MKPHDITLRNALRSELDWVFATEANALSGTVLPYSREKHEEEFSRETVKYKMVLSNGLPAGFIILALDSDPRSVEFRRIVISRPGCGLGRRAVLLLDEVCLYEFDRNRIWLDVFAQNLRARHVYEACGYIHVSEARLDDRTLIF